MIGRRLSHYEIIEEISRGGMGVVYRARDVNLGREVALKVLPEELLHDPGRRDRLLQEARAASALEHPHIAVIHAVGDADGVTFIAMELVRGEKLSDMLSHGPLPQGRALALATEVAEGLGRAHEKNIIHRDLKPANVMVTDEGHVKVIDFGLAKLVEPIGQDVATASVRTPRTDPGVVLGTAAYMSPEQARGARVDHRSDIFAFGVMLYEMLTGRPAFQGQSSLDTMQAILTQPVPPLPAVAGASTDVTAELQRIIAKCTAKDVDDRFQGMKDIVVDLRAARRRLESAPISTVAAPVLPQERTLAVRGNRTRILAGAGLAAAAVVAAALWWTGRRPPPPANSSGKPAVAVLYFANDTGDASLDWMRIGLTDMMVTDLSQSTEIEVLGTDRLVQILQDLKRSDDRVMSADVVQEIARRSGVDKVLMGSYVRAGGTIRISARLQDAQTGRIVSAERVDGVGESSLFALVDELTRRFKSNMTDMIGGRAGTLLPRPGEAPGPGLDRGLIDVTTPSIEAYKSYAEGINFHERGLSSQALPFLEKAIALDPNFAMAYAKLAVVNANLGLFDKRDGHAKHALDLSSRLTTRERYYIEGFYYGLRPETIARSIQAYQEGLKLHPEHAASRHNLGLHFMELERFPEAIEQYEELVRRGSSNPTTYENLSTMLIETGNVPRARQIAEDYVRREPESAAGLRMLGAALEAAGRLDEARDAFTKAWSLAPGDFITRLGNVDVAILQERWADADMVIAEFAASPSPFDRFLGLATAAQIAAVRGRGAALLDALERASRVPGLSSQLRALAHNRLALLLLRQHEPARALAQADLALVDARGRDAEFETLRLLAVAQGQLDRKADAEKTLALLESRAKLVPSDREVRRVHWARGEIALAMNDAGTAMTELARTAATLPVHGPPNGPPTPHADIWFDAAYANIKGGRDADAVPLLERLQSGHERVFAMDAYARSFYLLAQILERRGDAAGAQRQYARFLDLWRDGDLEREWILDAQKKVSR